jgi:TRAP-type C4-dicarboxylate transport system substrate-binding protein
VKKIWLTLLVVVLMSGLILGGCAEPAPTPAPAPSPAPAPAPAPEEPILLRVATPWPPMDPPTVLIQEMADRFNARTGGRCTMEVHPGESLVKVQESLDAVRTGAVEMAGFPPGVFVSVDPRLAAAAMPFLFTGVKADAAAQELILPMYNEFMPDKFNQMMVDCFTNSGLEIASNKPIKTLEDWDGLLVHAISPVISQVIEILGGAPVSAPFVEGYSVLEKKVVDAGINATEFMLTFKIYEVADYLTTGYIVPSALTVTINMDTYNSLPDDIHKILAEESLQMHNDANTHFIKITDENPVKLVELGMEHYVLPPAERERWRDVVWPYTESLMADMGEWGQRLEQVAEQINSQYPY